MLSVGIELFHRALLACILPSNDSDLAAALKQALQSLRPWGEALLAKRALRCSEALHKLVLQRSVENCKSAQAWWTSSHCDAGCFQERRLSKQPAGDKNPILYSLTKLSFLFAKDCLLTGQEQACFRITQLFVQVVVRHHAKNGLLVVY